MKDLIIPVNNEALARAMNAVAGEDQTKLIVAAYGLIDQAMVFGYAKAVAEGEAARAADAKEYTEALDRAYGHGYSTAAREVRTANEESFRGGYDAGFNDAASSDQQESYDDGYVDGVSDARAFPKFADDQVALLCADQEYYEGDSGDETDSGIWAAYEANGH